MHAATDIQDKESRVLSARERFIARYPKSKDLYERAHDSMPGGNTRSPLHFSPFPLTMQRAEGAKIWDADGYEYLNFHGEYSAGLSGHSNPKVIGVLQAALEFGLSRSGPNSVDLTFAESVCNRFPAIERVRFTNSGTEANMMALAAAMHSTQRQKIVVFDGAYHGSGLSFIGESALWVLPFDFVRCAYNDRDEIARVFRKFGDEIAAVVVEPMQAAGGCIPADVEFLETLRALTHNAGAVLIFDEVVTSRLGAGSGLQAEYGILPDITTLGKYIAGGVPIGAFGGGREIMEQFNPTASKALYHAGTFNNNILSMSAGSVVLSEVYTPEVAQSLNARGDELRKRLNELSRNRGSDLQFTGLGSVMTAHFVAGDIKRRADLSSADEQMKELFFFFMLDHGIYLTRRGMAALTVPIEDAHCDRFSQLVDEFLIEHAA